MFTDLESFFSLADSAMTTGIENFTTPHRCSYTTFLFIGNHDISLRVSLVFGH